MVYFSMMLEGMVLEFLDFLLLSCSIKKVEIFLLICCPLEYTSAVLFAFLLHNTTSYHFRQKSMICRSVNLQESLKQLPLHV